MDFNFLLDSIENKIKSQVNKQVVAQVITNIRRGCVKGLGQAGRCAQAGETSWIKQDPRAIKDVSEVVWGRVLQVSTWAQRT